MPKKLSGDISDAEFEKLVGESEQQDSRSARTLTLETEEKDEAGEVGVKLDGVFYEYANPQEWSLYQRNQWTQLYEKLQRLEKVKEPTETHEELYNEYSIRLLQKAVPELPKDKLQFLNITKRSLLLADFLLKSAERGGILSLMNSALIPRQSSS